MRDVALEAGLSVTQASRALNGHDDVAMATRERAAKAAETIGYVPNLEARRLKMPETRANSIGLVLSGQGRRFSDPFFAELLSWIVDEAASSGFEIQLSTPPSAQDPLVAYRRAIQQKRVDGFIVTRLEIDDVRVNYLKAENFPFVTYGRLLPDTGGYPAVDEGDESLGPAVDLLVDLGHRRIACIAEPGRHSKAAYRLRSFERALARRDIECRADQIVEAEFWEDSGHAGALSLLTQKRPPTAIVAFNDLLAMGALRAAAELGISVPDQLSVVGFDDIEAARLVNPALTTMKQPTETVGRLLVQRLLATVNAAPDEQPESEAHMLITPELVVRGSTAPPPSDS
ncbi:MAG: LacI family DNA-binding transcriptional regulator [Acidimicrobiales bacterium]